MKCIPLILLKNVNSISNPEEIWLTSVVEEGLDKK